jgi:uncharacterized protein (UPF0262 family)
MTETPAQTDSSPRDRIANITLDQETLAAANPNIEHEREVAIFDLLDGNTFAVDGRSDGPYNLKLSVADDRLNMVITTAENENELLHPVSLQPFKRLIKDYFMICDTYYSAIRNAPPSRIQAIDQSRRQLHDEGGRILQERLKAKITVDFDTARRLFTLMSTLHWKG